MSPFFFVSPPLKERAEKNGSIRDSTSSSFESICNNYLKLFRGDRREKKVCEGRDICRVRKTVSKQYSVSYVSFIESILKNIPTLSSIHMFQSISSNIYIAKYFQDAPSLDRERRCRFASLEETRVSS